MTPRRKCGIPATLASPPAPHPRHSADPGDPGPGATREASSGMGTGARDERLLWPWLHVTERASQGLRLHGGLRMAGALPRPSPSHWGTPSNGKRRRVTEPRTRTCLVQEASPGLGGLRPSRRESLTRDVHWEEGAGRRARIMSSSPALPLLAHDPPPCASAALFRVPSSEGHRRGRGLTR